MCELELEQACVHLSSAPVCFHSVLRSHHQLQERPPQWQAEELSESGGSLQLPTSGPSPVSVLQPPLCSKNTGASLIVSCPRAGGYTGTHKTEEVRGLLLLSLWISVISMTGFKPRAVGTLHV